MTIELQKLPSVGNVEQVRLIVPADTLLDVGFDTLFSVSYDGDLLIADPFPNLDYTCSPPSADGRFIMVAPFRAGLRKQHPEQLQAEIEQYYMAARLVFLDDREAPHQLVVGRANGERLEHTSEVEVEADAIVRARLVMDNLLAQ